MLAGLAGIKQPQMDRHDARHYLRASARASEGIGDDSAALNWYGRFVKFASQPVECGTGCHAMEGPKDRRFFRDWWAGARFARYALKTKGIRSVDSLLREGFGLEPFQCGSENCARIPVRRRRQEGQIRSNVQRPRIRGFRA